MDCEFRGEKLSAATMTLGQMQRVMWIEEKMQDAGEAQDKTDNAEEFDKLQVKLDNLYSQKCAVVFGRDVKARRSDMLPSEIEALESFFVTLVERNQKTQPKSSETLQDISPNPTSGPSPAGTT